MRGLQFVEAFHEPERRRPRRLEVVVRAKPVRTPAVRPFMAPMRGLPFVEAPPESRRRDRFDKRDLYEQHGVREYWLIDPEAETVEVLHAVKGQFRLVGRWHPGEQAASKILPGFKVRVAELFSRS